MPIKMQNLDGFKYLINVYSPSMMGAYQEACYIADDWGKAEKIIHHEVSRGHMVHILHMLIHEELREFDNREASLLQ